MARHNQHATLPIGLVRRVRVALSAAAVVLAVLHPSSPLCAPSSDPLDLLKRSITAMQRQDSLLANYHYMKTVVTESLDRDLTVRKKEEKLMEVTSLPHAPDLEVLVAVNGKPLTEKERKKSEEDRRKSAGSVRPRLNPEDLVTQFDWSLAGAEDVNGRPATVLRFRPKPGAVYEGKDANAEKLLKKVSGRVWVDDQEFVITRVEFESAGQVKSMGGLFWTLRTLRVREERRRLDDGVWIDSDGEYFVDATALLVKNIVRRSTSHTFGYRRPGDSPVK